MIVDFRLTVKQADALKRFVSWSLERMQGTGVRYWRLTYSDKPEFRGNEVTIEARTFKRLMELANIIDGL